MVVEGALKIVATAANPRITARLNMPKLRNLIVVLGDQLDLEASSYDNFDARVDAVWMAEVADESTSVW